MEDKLKILLVEDSEADADLLLRHLTKENVDFHHERVWSKPAFLKALVEYKPDLIIADHNLPGFNGMEAFDILKAGKKNIPFILVTGSISEKLLIEYAKEGIDDYLLKNNLLRLPSAIENVLNRKKVENLHNKLLQTNLQLESVYADLKDSINYAKKIQEAMLPELSELKDIFPDSFILFRPKDVLSGDFYWYEKKEDVFLIAVADCTGHGVPGALLSMMGNDLLVEAVNVRSIRQPSKVLGRLNERVRKVLKHDTSDIRDGMDIAFCSVGLKNNVLEYAGANRPLYIIRDKNMLEFKPDKIAIGEGEDGESVFTDHRVELKSGDRIFLFSDGYSDQFNGISNKKMMSKRFKRLLLHTAHIPFPDQEKMLVDFFAEWKGNSPQTDDVLLIGIMIR